jgi:flagellar hook-associated protein 2
MAISSPGIGSGIDIGELVNKLVESEGANKSNQLNLKEAELQADISAFGSLKGALSIFQTAVKDLQNAADFQNRSATSSNTDVFTATADETADFSQYGIEVVQLAQANKLITQTGFADAEAVGAGTLTIAQGAASFSLSISSTDTLTDIRDAINTATDNSGVSAAVINVDDGLGGTEQKLVFTASETGTDKAITITTVDDDGDHVNALGLSRLVSVNLDEPAAALNGQIKVDNQLISSQNDTFSEVIDGITINAVAVGAGESLSVAQDKKAVEAKVNAFIANYNGLTETINKLGAYDEGTKTGGILLGDSTLRSVQDTIRREISASVSGLGGAFSTLAELGVTTDEDGKLSLDDKKFNAALDSNFDQVGELFASTNGIANKLESLIDGYIGSNGLIGSRTEGIQHTIEDVADQRLRLNRRLESLESRLLKQFTAMDVLVNTLQNQSNFLTQQLDNLPGAYKPK